MPANRPLQLAVLIDAENFAATHADHLFAEVAKRGDAHIRRIYADFSLASVKPWADAVSRHSLIAQQQFNIVTGKNSSDIMLVIDAMDMLHGGGLDGFFIASSDSDFSRLAQRIREAGLKVFGYGSSMAQECLRRSCHEFITFQAKAAVPPAKQKPVAAAPESRSIPAGGHNSGERSLKEACGLICRAVEAHGDPGAWMGLGELGNHLHNLSPGFKPKSYGAPTLGKLVQRIGEFETRRGPGDAICIRARNTENKAVSSQ